MALFRAHALWRHVRNLHLALARHRRPVHRRVRRQWRLANSISTASTTSFSIAVGGGGAAGGDGNSVSVSVNDTSDMSGRPHIDLRGPVPAILAQSIGGGGGNGGASQAHDQYAAYSASYTAMLAVGGMGAAGARRRNRQRVGGRPALHLRRFLAALFAQSVGGGGGNAAHPRLPPAISSPARQPPTSSPRPEPTPPPRK